MALNLTLIGGAVAATIIAGLAGLTYLERREANSLRADKVRLEEQNAGLLTINANQGAAIARLTNQLQIDQQFTTNFANTLAAIREETATQAQALTELTNDPEASSFLNTRVPDSVKRVYRSITPTPEARPADSDRNRTGRPANPLP